MAAISLSEDDGYVTVSCLGGTELTFDLYRVHYILGEFWADHTERNVPNVQTCDDLIELLVGLGFPATPKMSQRLALRFTEEIAARVEETKKKDEPSLAPADSTASTYST